MAGTKTAEILSAKAFGEQKYKLNWVYTYEEDA